MKLVMKLGGSLLFLGALSFAAPPPPTVVQKGLPPEGCAVEIYGDSLMLPRKVEGAVVNLPGLLEQALPGLKVTNSSVEFLSLNDAIGGYLARGTARGTVMMPSFTRRVRVAPITVIALGSIDALLDYGQYIFEQQLRLVVQSVLDDGGSPILVGAHKTVVFQDLAHRRNPTIQIDQFDQIIRQVANETGAAYVRALDLGEGPAPAQVKVLTAEEAKVSQAGPEATKLVNTLKQAVVEACWKHRGK